MRPGDAAGHMMSSTTNPIPIRAFKLATVKPRQISAMTASDGSLICLNCIAFPDAVVGTKYITHKPENRSG
jgi:hypothetical protein